MAIDVEGLIPEEYSNQIIQEAVQQSAALSLGTRLPMGTRISHMPIPTSFPEAGWVSGPGGRKPVSGLGVGSLDITAEELAVVLWVPDQIIDDVSINLWGYVRPLATEALARALDAAVFFGTNAPPSFPAGGISAFAETVTGGADAVATVNDAMAAVELGGLNVTGHAADVSVRAALRGVRDQAGALLLGPGQVGAGPDPMGSIYGVPVAWTQFPHGDFDFVTGAWRYCVIGVRQDIRFAMDSNAVLPNADGTIAVSGFVDNVTAIKLWARFGLALIKPVTPRSPEGANPFAVAQIGPGVPEGAPAGGGGGDTDPEERRRQRSSGGAGAGATGAGGQTPSAQTRQGSTAA